MVGQDEPLRAVSDAVRRSRAGLGDPTVRSGASCSRARPWARPRRKALAEFLFDTEDAMAHRHVRVHGEARGVARSAPPGYVGYEEGGVLTEAVGAGPTRWCCSTRSRSAPDVFNVAAACSTTGA